MYLTGVTGSWSMYGYQSGVTTTEHLQNQDYKVCIRREDGYCSVRHTATSSTSFDLSSAANADTAISVAGATCYADFVNIPGGSLDGNPETKDRYCGGALGFPSPGVPVSQAIISKFGLNMLYLYLILILQQKWFPSRLLSTLMVLKLPVLHPME